MELGRQVGWLFGLVMLRRLWYNVNTMSCVCRSPGQPQPVEPASSPVHAIGMIRRTRPVFLLNPCSGSDPTGCFCSVLGHLTHVVDSGDVSGLPSIDADDQQA